jgi:hypothetical protein
MGGQVIIKTKIRITFNARLTSKNGVFIQLKGVNNIFFKKTNYFCRKVWWFANNIGTLWWN